MGRPSFMMSERPETQGGIESRRAKGFKGLKATPIFFTLENGFEFGCEVVN